MGRLQGRFFAPSFLPETPSGTVDGSNVTFTVAQTPANAAGLELFLNGVRQQVPTDYSISGSTITMTTAPVSGQTLYARYISAT